MATSAAVVAETTALRTAARVKVWLALVSHRLRLVARYVERME